MPVQRAASASSLVDVLERVLERGVVVDVPARARAGGIDLVAEGARVVVSTDTDSAPRPGPSAGDSVAPR